MRHLEPRDFHPGGRLNRVHHRARQSAGASAPASAVHSHVHGGFNWSSQHPEHGGVHEKARGMDDAVDGQVRDLPSDDHTGREVDDGRQARPALARAQVRDVADQPGARLIGREVPLDQVGRVLVIEPVHGRDPIREWLHGSQAQIAHQAGDQAEAARMPADVQHLGDTPAPVRLPELLERFAHEDRELPAARGGRRHHAASPLGEARPRNPQQAANPGDRVARRLAPRSTRNARLRLRPCEEGRCFFWKSLSSRSRVAAEPLLRAISSATSNL